MDKTKSGLSHPLTRSDNALLEELLGLTAAGSNEAFEQLYHLTSSAAFSFALSLVKNYHEAEDILHDCYLRVFSFAGSYQPQGKPMAWIITIVKNLCYSRLEKQGRHTPIEDLAEQLQSAPTDSAEERALVQSCMSLLSEEEQKIVSLHAVAGMKHREIAAILDIPLSTVLSKYNRALKKLRKVLEKGESI